MGRVTIGDREVAIEHVRHSEADGFCPGLLAYPGAHELAGPLRSGRKRLDRCKLLRVKRSERNFIPREVVDYQLHVNTYLCMTRHRHQPNLAGSCGVEPQLSGAGGGAIGEHRLAVGPGNEAHGVRVGAGIPCHDPAESDPCCCKTSAIYLEVEPIGAVALVGRQFLPQGVQPTGEHRFDHHAPHMNVPVGEGLVRYAYGAELLL